MTKKKKQNITIEKDNIELDLHPKSCELCKSSNIEIGATCAACILSGFRVKSNFKKRKGKVE